jgi:hypothetical protein
VTPLQFALPRGFRWRGKGKKLSAHSSDGVAASRRDEVRVQSTGVGLKEKGKRLYAQEKGLLGYIITIFQKKYHEMRICPAPLLLFLALRYPRRIRLLFCEPFTAPEKTKETQLEYHRVIRRIRALSIAQATHSFVPTPLT